jgi:hypothetical protein
VVRAAELLAEPGSLASLTAGFDFFISVISVRPQNNFAAVGPWRAKNVSLPRFSLCGLAKTHPEAATVLVDKFDAGGFDRVTYFLRGVSAPTEFAINCL